jgi:hypothetical protein
MTTPLKLPNTFFLKCAYRGEKIELVLLTFFPIKKKKEMKREECQFFPISL